ncbi:MULTISPECIES: hypothetical protein [Kamptonema]|uniref:hypothetical protein n=1 Tax=Kamptonema TaxID=1501433 RepID=UPI0001DAD5B4|nr:MULTISPECIES: hypothetical protein [Kamptonema]CBN54734.1 hypothetical protein OSCI_1060002 [Kamptonema sp. PCC 6506]
MVGARQFIANAGIVAEAIAKSKHGCDSNSPDSNVTGNFVKRILVQSKKLSHLIVHIWLNRPGASELDKYFKQSQNLSKLLLASDPNSVEYKLLRNIFQPQDIPIFNEEEGFYYSFKVTVNQFEGSLDDPLPGQAANPGEKGVFTMWIPYPPRPEISTDPIASLHPSELEEWLKSPVNHPPYFYAANPYIPTSTT